MATLLWKPLPIMTLTVRQFIGGKAVRVVSVIALIPTLFALIYLIDSNWTTPFAFISDNLFLGLYSPTILPIVTLILATSALGNEVEDRTLPYLTLKPVSRLRIVLEKMLGVLAVALPVNLLGVAISFAIAAQAEGPRRFVGRLEQPDLAPLLPAMLIATTLGVIAFSALFIMASLFIPRALLVGIIYAFVWESLLGRFLPGIRIVSVRHYVQSAFTDVLDNPTVTIDRAFTLTTSLVTIGVVVLIAVVISTRRLRRMNLE